MKFVLGKLKLPGDHCPKGVDPGINCMLVHCSEVVVVSVVVVVAVVIVVVTVV